MLKETVLIVLFLFICPLVIFARGWIHITDETVPVITTQWRWNNKNDQQLFKDLDQRTHVFFNKTITSFPLFKTFNFEEMETYRLPSGSITYRNAPTKTILGSELEKMVEKFFNEVLAKKTNYTDFVILKNADFNLKKQAGLLIVKAKKYPFVVKLFMETPRSFLRPYNKGIIPLLQFGINGGATRHLVGFTRVKNSYTTMDILQKSIWKDKVDVPRKWYWTPSNYPWIFITANNLGSSDSMQSILLPGAYALITDYIESDHPFSLTCAQDRADALSISNAVQCRIDPHINNFLREKSTGKIVIIDTEHFPTLTGMQKAPVLKSYSQLYFDLGLRYLQRNFFSLKKERIERQASTGEPFCKP